MGHTGEDSGLGAVLPGFGNDWECAPLVAVRRGKGDSINATKLTKKTQKTSERFDAWAVSVTVAACF
jgi:hypothetical protein